MESKILDSIRTAEGVISIDYIKRDIDKDFSIKNFSSGSIKLDKESIGLTFGLIFNTFEFKFLDENNASLLYFEIYNNKPKSFINKGYGRIAFDILMNKITKEKINYFILRHIAPYKKVKIKEILPNTCLVESSIGLREYIIHCQKPSQIDLLNETHLKFYNVLKNMVNQLLI